MDGDEPELEIPAPDGQKALDWMTALSARELPCRLCRRGGAWILCVPDEYGDAALAELGAYEKDNADWPPARPAQPAEPPAGHTTWSAPWAAGFLVCFHAWLGAYDPESPVLSAAAADAGRILAGEWWRVVTALTVHSGVGHLLANAASLLFFGHAVGRLMGGGLGWMLILATGILGNAAGAVALGDPHVSVGASTAGFGALGILTVAQTVANYRRWRDWRSVWSRTWIPLAAGIGLLALLGAGPGTDVAAHIFGFAFGLLLALPVAWAGTRRVPEWCQRLLELACIAIVMTAWRAAFRLALS